MFVFEHEYEPTVKATALIELENASINASITASQEVGKETHKADSDSSLIYKEIESNNAKASNEIKSKDVKRRRLLLADLK